MNAPVTHLRSEDLLEEREPKRLSRKFRLSARRQITGLVVAALLLPLTTLLLQALDGQLDLDAQVLVYLLAVVVISLIGGIVVAFAAAAVSAFVINYFFVEPVHTLAIDNPDQVVTLVVFVVVAGLVSGAVEFAVRRAQVAERALKEAETLSALAGPNLEEPGSLDDVLHRARETFGMESVTLKARPAGEDDWVDIAHAGWAPPGSEAPLQFDVAAGPRVRLVGRGPALFAEDHRVLDAFAAAALTAYEGRRLSGEAEEARTLAVADRQRTALLAAVGHDLRTPLAGIKASVGSLRQADVSWSDDERTELLATIEEAADRLDGIVRNLLDASRLEAGALPLHLDDVALDEVVAAALLGVAAPADRFQVEVAEDLPAVRADRAFLERVLVNVLDNAVRHGGAEQPIEISAHCGAESAKIEIADHGPGVSGHRAETLFEPFQGGGDRQRDGVGLGLSVARGFLEAMGGGIVADQTFGGGLTMRIRLPLASGARSDTASASA